MIQTSTPPDRMPCTVDCELSCGPDRRAGLEWLLRTLVSHQGLAVVFVEPGRGSASHRIVVGGPGQPGPGTRQVLRLPLGEPPRSLAPPVDHWQGRLPLFAGPGVGLPDDSADPVIHSTDGGRAFVRRRREPGPTLYTVDRDLLGPAFHELARLEELDPARRAAFHDGRGLQSDAGRADRLDQPWLDELSHTLVDLLDPEGELPRQARWPGLHRWALCLSHDVDMLYKWRLRSVIRLLLESPLHALAGRSALLARLWRELARKLARGEDPWWLAEEMLELERRQGALSSFLFLAESHDHRTYRYHLGRAAVRALLQQLARGGADLQLHGGWHSLGSPERLQHERERFRRAAGRPATVVRQHYLRFRREHTWRDQQQSGFATDSTLGWNDRPGFRAGTRLPFHPWDLDHNRPHTLLEVPLALMDSQFYFERPLDAGAAARRIETLVEQAADQGGLLCVNWHPHVLCRADFPGLAELYEGLLERAMARDPWCVTLAELDRWWRPRLAGRSEGGAA